MKVFTKGKRIVVLFAGCTLAHTLYSQTTATKITEQLSVTYRNRSVIKELQGCYIQTETENYSVQPVAKYNSLYSNYGLAGFVAYNHTGPFRHHMSAGGLKFIYGKHFNSSYSQAIVFEGMYGVNTERTEQGVMLKRTNVYGIGLSGNVETKWLGASLGVSAGKYLLRNDENINFFSQRYSSFDIFGRWRIRVLPHRWFFLEYGSNNLFLFQGGQGQLRTFAAGSGLGFQTGTEVKVGYLKFLKWPGYFFETTIYTKNTYGLGANYTVYQKGSRFLSFKVCYRFK